jgi:hypothetical protein
VQKASHLLEIPSALHIRKRIQRSDEQVDSTYDCEKLVVGIHSGQMQVFVSSIPVPNSPCRQNEREEVGRNSLAKLESSYWMSLFPVAIRGGFRNCCMGHSSDWMSLKMCTRDHPVDFLSDLLIVSARLGGNSYYQPLPGLITSFASLKMLNLRLIALSSTASLG